MECGNSTQPDDFEQLMLLLINEIEVYNFNINYKTKRSLAIQILLYATKNKIITHKQYIMHLKY